MADHDPDPIPPPTTAPLDDPSSLPLPDAHTLLSSFSSWLIVAIHSILYYRSIYPRITFLASRAYNLPVRQNRHPKVCAWIRDAVRAVSDQLAGGNVDRVALVIHTPLHPPAEKPDKPSSDRPSTEKPSTEESAPEEPPAEKPSTEGPPAENPFTEKPSTEYPSTENPSTQKSSTEFSTEKPPTEKSSAENPPTSLPAASPAAHLPGAVLERWMFDVGRFPVWPGGSGAMRDFGNALNDDLQSGDEEGDPDLDEELDDEGEDDDDADDPSTSPVNWADVDQQLRGALRRIASAAEALPPLPDGCTFTVAVELKEEGDAPIGHPQPWIPSEPNLQPASSTRRKSGKDIGGSKTTPVRSVEAGPLFFECWVEQGKR